MTKLFEIRNATVVRDGQTILDNVTWSGEQGCHQVILGANGSGKTTLLKVLTGYEWPTKGSVTVMGELFGETNIGELRKRVGWVSSSLAWKCKDDDSAGAVVLSGIDASIGLWRDDFTDSEMMRAARMLQLMGADTIADRPWGVLSQGERQRTLIARALVADPELLILDEPCAGLDPVAREKLLSDLGEYLEKHPEVTFILVTHHLEEIKPWIQEMVLIRDGRILDQGPLQGLMTSENVSAVFGARIEVVVTGSNDTISMTFKD